MELTILMPCLNEENTIANCIKKAKEFIEKNKIDAEILIADNGSTDNSVQISKSLGVRVVQIKEKGYGNALRKGTINAKGKYVIIGDSDESYDFTNLECFIAKLKEGYDLVIGNRYGGKIEKGAMKFTHRYIGTPIISFVARKKFKTNIKDFNSGLRGYNNEKIINLNCKAEGMEYASEMIIKAKKANLKITEIPINFYKDKRKRKPHLNTIRDGLRHIKLIVNEM